MNVTSGIPKAFISYAWENRVHQDWVRALASRLRRDGVDVTLDCWHAIPGDQLPQFMERSVRENDFVLIICTPRYKFKSDNRTGGVGYEGDIMTAEISNSRNQRKFIPILREGEWAEAAPTWLFGKYYIDLRGIKYSEENYQDLLRTLHNQRETAPPIGVYSQPMSSTVQDKRPVPAEISQGLQRVDTIEPIRITRVVAEDMTKPRNDGTRGSGLYAVPFQLSRRPNAEWARLLIENWNHPPQFSTMHRPGIARVVGDRILLDGTTIQEVEQYHLKTLKLVLERVNSITAQQEKVRQQREEAERLRLQEHSNTVNEIADRLKFD